MREEGRIFQFPCNLQLLAQVCGSGGAGFLQPMPVHPQTAPYGPLQLAGHRSGGLAGPDTSGACFFNWFDGDAGRKQLRACINCPL